MPIYEYICKNCEYEFEKIRSFSDSTMPACPTCESDDVERKLGVPAIHFKGSGWYINDSKSSNSNGAGNKKETGAAEKSDNSASDTAESSSSENKSKDSSESKSSDSSKTVTKETSTNKENSKSSAKKAD